MMNTKKYVLGFDIGGTYIRVALACDREIVASQVVTWPLGMSSTEEVQFIADMGLTLAKSHTDSTVKAAGIALAALTDQEGNVVDWPNRPTWRGLAFQSLLAVRLAVPTFVEDDANAAALAEWQLGAGQGYSNMLVVMVGTGIGSGIILNGELLRGQNGWAGELGHQIIMPDGPTCTCGNKGCVQVLASGQALNRIALDRGLGDAQDIVVMAKHGEEWARNAIIACGCWLGLVVANVVNLLDLHAVVVGGGLCKLGVLWWTALTQTLRANLLAPAHREVAIQQAALPDTAGLIGAICLAHQKIYT